jgi:type IV fimbrial biogenesis protein FimT
VIQASLSGRCGAQLVAPPVPDSVNRQKTGFTLIELVVTVALLAILLALAGPPLRELVLNNRRATQINDLMVSLNLARAEAVKRGETTFVCVSNAEERPDCDARNVAWERGWLVVVDSNRDGRASIGEGDLLVHTHRSLADDTTLGFNDRTTGVVRFNSKGFSSTSSTTGTFTLCDIRGEAEARGIVLYGTGRARKAIDGSDADEIVENGSGSNLTCPPLQ